LRNLRRPLDIGETVERYTAGAAALADALPSLLDEQFAAEGVPESIAQRVAYAEALVPALHLADIAAESDLDVTAVAQLYFALGERLELHWLRDRIVTLPRDTRWAAMARAALRDDVYAEQAALTAEVIRTGGDIDAWFAQNRDAVERCLQVLGDMKAGGAPDLARLSVAVREIRNLTQSSAATVPSRA
jgi:glutamate dehydrogenase